MVTWRFSGGLALVASLLVLSRAADAAILPRQSDKPLQPWVTVDATGASVTVTPTVNDGKTTSAFPGSTTLPTADASGAGSFLLCNKEAGSGGLDQPFCSPWLNSEIEGGKTYWVTWDADLFPSPLTVVQVQGDYGATDYIEPGHGFSSQMMPASQGHFAWAAVGYEMAPGDALEVQLALAVPATNGSITGRHLGPKVRIVGLGSLGSRRGPNVFGIVLPIVFGVLALVGIAWFVWWYGRKKGMFASPGQGYGIGKSRGQRAADVKIGLGDTAFSSPDRGVEMMPPPPAPPRPPPPSGENAFRQELSRQERNYKAQGML